MSNSLANGTRLGSYEIQSPIGAGGMGEVYRALDTRLNRSVAVKILPPHLAADPDFAQRFEREARTIAGLSHPNICTLYDVGRHNDVAYLVMELLQGDTLAAVLDRGPLPLDRALKAAIEIADALDCAHRSGIVHRDLKPGNVMLTPSGVKLLDFGLARSDVAPTSDAIGLSALPTARSAPLTARGTILGTFQYMAPEQLEAQDVDARTDVFAFGAVLYEMLTGRRAFEGKTQASLIGAILKDEPPAITLNQPVAPPALDHIVRRCLAKRPEDRWQSIRDARLELEWVQSDDARRQAPAPQLPTRRWREIAAWAAAIAIGVVASALLLTRDTTFVPGPLVRFDLPSPRELQMNPQGMTAAPSPDGRWIALAGNGTDGAPIVLRDVHDATLRPLAGTEGGTALFWSRDSQRIGFNQNQRPMTMDISAGSARPVCQCQFAAGTWLDDDTILYSAVQGGGAGITRVRLSTGASDKVTDLDATRGEVAHRMPHALPDGRHFLFVAASGDSRWTVFVASVDSRDRKPLAIESNVAYVEPGFLLFGRDDALVAQPFDPKRLELTGQPFKIAAHVERQNRSGAFRLAASRNGVVTLWSGEGGQVSQLLWVDRKGVTVSTAGASADYSNPSLSPDGTRIAVGIRGATGTRDIWVLDPKRPTRQRLTTDPADDFNPIWAGDGHTLYFSSDRSGSRRIYRGDAFAPGKEQMLASDDPPAPSQMNVEAITPDGLSLVFNRNGDPNASQHLRLLPVSGGASSVLRQSPLFTYTEGQVSPDGHWLSYTSNSNGQREVYVTTFPTPGREWQVSTLGGSQAQWSQNGRELTYVEGDGRFMAVPVSTTRSEFMPGTPQFLFERLLAIGVYRNKYVLSADGQQFLINAGIDQREQTFSVMADWRALLPK